MKFSFKRIFLSIFLLFAGLLLYWLVRYYVWQPLDFDDFTAQLYWKYIEHDPDGYTRMAPETPLDPLLLPYTADITGLHYAVNMPENEATRAARITSKLQDLNAYRFEQLNTDQQLTYRVIKQQLDWEQKALQFPAIPYPFNAVDGQPWQLLDLLIHHHPVTTPDLADSYMSRLRNIPRALEAGIRQSPYAANPNLIPPRPCLLIAIRQLKRWISMPPNANPLYTSLARKLAAADPTSIHEGLRVDYLGKTEQTLSEKVYPAFTMLITHLEGLLDSAPDAPGIWQYSKGAEAYAFWLEYYAGESLDPASVPLLAAEVIQEAEAALQAADFPQPYPASPGFSTQTLNYAREFADLGAGLFDALPEVRAVILSEPDSLWIAPSLYISESEGVGRRTTLYITDSSFLRSSAYRQLVPGRLLIDFQSPAPLMIQQHPSPAYLDGWSGYANELVAEYGFFQGDGHGSEPHVQRLIAGASLAADYGIHMEQWSVSKADTFLDSTLSRIPESSRERLLDRIISQPGYAIASVAGTRQMLALRAYMEEKMGIQFQIRDFHRIILQYGPIPPAMLKTPINQYIESTK